MKPTLKACFFLLASAVAWVIVVQWIEVLGRGLPAVINGGVMP
jgi:hypothetical protein